MSGPEGSERANDSPGITQLICNSGNGGKGTSLQEGDSMWG